MVRDFATNVLLLFVVAKAAIYIIDKIFQLAIRIVIYIDILKQLTKNK